MNHPLSFDRGHAHGGACCCCSLRLTLPPLLLPPPHSRLLRALFMSLMTPGTLLDSLHDALPPPHAVDAPRPSHRARWNFPSKQTVQKKLTWKQIGYRSLSADLVGVLQIGWNKSELHQFLLESASRLQPTHLDRVDPFRLQFPRIGVLSSNWSRTHPPIVELE